MHKSLVLFVMLIVGFLSPVSAQKYPERSSIRSGNRSYEKFDYQQAEMAYRRALDKQPESFEAAYNLSGAMFKQQRFDEAAQVLDLIKADSIAGDHASAVHYNRGNAHLAQEEIEQAIESYKEALRRNPQDMEAKYNLAYAQKMLQDPPQDDNQDNQGDGKGEGDGRDNNDQSDDQQNDQSDDNQDDDQDKPENDRDDDPSDNDQDDQGDADERQRGDGDDQSDPGGDDPDEKGKGGGDGRMSKQEAEQLLNAMQGAEDNTREKVDGQKVQAVGRSGKNW